MKVTYNTRAQIHELRSGKCAIGCSIDVGGEIESQPGKEFSSYERTHVSRTVIGVKMKTLGPASNLYYS